MVLNNCTVCDVYKSDSEAPVRVRARCTGERITLHFQKGHELSDSDRIRIDFFDGQIGYIKTYCELGVRRNYDPLILEPWMADCEILEVVDIVQRQKDLRSKVEKEISFRSVTRGAFTGVIEDINVGIIKNISVGGLYLTTKTQLEVGEAFEFTYCFTKKEHTVKAVILRKQNLKKDLFGYGCQFVDLPKAAERDIRQYVYKLQLMRPW